MLLKAMEQQQRCSDERHVTEVHVCHAEESELYPISWDDMHKSIKGNRVCSRWRQPWKLCVQSTLCTAVFKTGQGKNQNYVPWPSSTWSTSRSNNLNNEEHVDSRVDIAHCGCNLHYSLCPSQQLPDFVQAVKFSAIISSPGSLVAACDLVILAYKMGAGVTGWGFQRKPLKKGASSTCMAFGNLEISTALQRPCFRCKHTCYQLGFCCKQHYWLGYSCVRGVKS